jgi:hypothetical protein
VRHGANMVLRHADVTLFAEALRNEVNHICETLGDQSGATGSQVAEYINRKELKRLTRRCFDD